MKSIDRVHIIISGDVQGVSREARSCFAGGSVEVVAEGAKKDLEALIKECHRGPDVAWVKGVDVSWEETTHEFMGFEVVY